jgi:hypothetical protein
MKPTEKLELTLRKAKLHWRRIAESPGSTSSDKRRALVEWKKALARRDLALAVLRRARDERRKAMLDRRKANTGNDWTKENADRRKMARRP